MNKKLLIISTIFLIISVVLFTISQFRMRNVQNMSPVPQAEPGPLGGVNNQPQGALFSPEAINLQNKIQEDIKNGTVPVKPSVLPTAKVVDTYPPGLSISQVPDYQTVYIPETNEFHILLFLFPLADTRVRAQQYFLQKLGVTEQEACMLQVVVAVTPDVSESLAGKNLGLSFCPESTDLSSYTENTDGTNAVNQEQGSDIRL